MRISVLPVVLSVCFATTGAGAEAQSAKIRGWLRTNSVPADAPMAEYTQGNVTCGFSESGGKCAELLPHGRGSETAANGLQPLIATMAREERPVLDSGGRNRRESV